MLRVKASVSSTLVAGTTTGTTVAGPLDNWRGDFFLFFFAGVGFMCFFFFPRGKNWLTYPRISLLAVVSMGVTGKRS